MTCNAEEAFTFVTDIRNFEQFIPKGNVNNWNAEKESCSFNVAMLGKVTLRLAEKEEYIKVIFNGDALKKNDFSLRLDISDNLKNPANVRLMLSAELNGMMKMLAAKPIDQFLGKLIDEIENFRGWKETKV